MQPWLLVLHLFGILLWTGSLLVVLLVLAAHTRETAAKAQASLSRLEMRIFRVLVHPGAALAVLGGLSLVLVSPLYYLHAPWFHAKLLLVLLLIVLDLRAYFRAKTFQGKNIQRQRRECVALGAVAAALLLGILVAVLVKPF